MPEGPEVRRVAQGLTALEGQRIVRAAVVSGRYSRGASLGLDELAGALIKRVTVKGKLIAFHLEKDQVAFAILSTLGMTGLWVPNFVDLDDSFKNHLRLQIETEQQTASFFDARNFGTFKVVTYQEMKRKFAELGPDILTPQKMWAAVSYPEFEARTARFGASVSIAEGLLDQRIAAGCGNYIRADAMYLSRFSPLRPMSSLSPTDLHLIWAAMNTIANVSSEGLWTNPVYGKAESPTGAIVKSYKDKHNRTVWWSPTEQS